MLFGGIAAILLVAVLAGGAWFLFLKDDAPEEVSLGAALDEITSGTPTTAPAAGATTAPTSAPSTPGINGTWNVDTTLASFVGYRVKEELASIGAFTAVGRTSVVSGSATIANNTVTAATITGDLTQLKSDSSLRDGQLRSQALETGRFPEATFTLTSPLTLPAGLESGTAVSTTLKGTLLLHGVTKEVEVPVEAQLKDGVLAVVGSIDIDFADYSISAPRSAAVLSVEDKGVMELQIFFKKA